MDSGGVVRGVPAVAVAQVALVRIQRSGQSFFIFFTKNAEEMDELSFSPIL